MMSVRNLDAAQALAYLPFRLLGLIDGQARPFLVEACQHPQGLLGHFQLVPGLVGGDLLASEKDPVIAFALGVDLPPEATGNTTVFLGQSPIGVYRSLPVELEPKVSLLP